MSNFDRAAQAWVKKHYGRVPDLGSVHFEIDAAAYASGGWCQFDVTFEVDGVRAGHTIETEAWSHDATGLMRELTEIDPEEFLSDE